VDEHALKAETAGGQTSLWAGLLGAPAAWAAQMQLAYMLVPWACQHHRHWPIHLTHFGFLALTLVGGWLSHREWHGLGRGWPRGSEGSSHERTRFLAVSGMGSSILFALLILGQAIASFLINPCWD
jgi:hypothetical protein